jgi:hypothetical protein
MPQSTRLVALTIGLLAFSAAAEAADGPVQLKPSATIAKGVAAFPRIVTTPDDKAAQRINQALDKRDVQAKNEIKDCRSNVSKASDADYERTVTVTMRGPRYLSFLANDSADCGGAHPDTSDMALVYDLGTGSPVNWQHLLPKAMVQSVSTDTVIDGTNIGYLTSRTLQDLYLKAASPIDPDCKDVLNDPDLNLSLWPDAKEDGIAVEPGDLPHVVIACADTMVIPTATLRPLGVDAALLDAIDAAHQGGFFDH